MTAAGFNGHVIDRACCNRCGRVKSCADFYRDRTKRTGRKSICKECCAKADFARNRQSRRAQANRDRNQSPQRRAYDVARSRRSERLLAMKQRTAAYRLRRKQFDRCLICPRCFRY
jgi:hypothetical protein